MLGGTSVINGMKYLRGSKQDHDEWEALGNPEWNFENALKYYKKSEDNADFENHYHGRGGLQPIGNLPWTHPMVFDIMLAGVEKGWLILVVSCVLILFVFYQVSKFRI